MKNKRWMRFLAMTLAVTVLATTVDTTLLAAPETATEEAVTEQEMERLITEDTGESDAVILSEVEEEREEDSKTFYMSDGSFMVAQYDVPIHYEDEEGEWQEIDRTLELETEEGAAMTAEAVHLEDAEEDAQEISEEIENQEEVYTTTERTGEEEKTKFASTITAGKTVTIQNETYPLSWGIQSTEPVEATLQEVQTAKANDAEEELLAADINSQVVNYPDIFPNVDAQYQVQATGIKENIILKQKEAKHAFTILYEIGGLVPEQIDDQTIVLTDGNEVIYQICAPYMQDASGSISEEVTLSMEQQTEGELAVTMTGEKDWLDDEERCYPVVLDPTVVTKTKKSAIDSTFITSGQANTNYSGKFELLIGKESATYKNCRALVKIKLPELNVGDMVVNAKMSLIMYGAEFYADTTPDLQINAHQIQEEWEYDKVTWNNRPAFDSTVLDYQYIGREDVENKEYEKQFDITEAVKSWYEGTTENHGIMVKSYTESGSYAETGVKGYFWPERYNSEQELYPRYYITYRNNKGLEDYWTYTTLSAGTAGTAYINDYTGNLVFVHEDVSTTGELLPVALQHVYNGYQRGNFV